MAGGTMSILLIDFETTGLDTNKARIIEVGAMVVDDTFARSFPLGGGFDVKTLTTLVYDEDCIVTPEITSITGITEEDVKTKGVSPAQMFKMLGNLIDENVKYIIAYNRSFDEKIFKAEVERHTMTLDPKINWLYTTPWLCAMTDIEENYKFKSWKQMHVALEYGITVNPKELHRAINDVELMRKILMESGTNVEEMYKFQTSPWIYIRALCRPPWEDKGASTTIAKNLGYTWEQAKGDADGRRFEKSWVKKIKEKNWEAEEKAAPFPIRKIGGSI